MSDLAMPPRVTRLTTPGQLSALQKEQMLALMSAHFDAVEPHRFWADLAAKQWVFLIVDAQEQVRGFTTLAHWQTRVDEQPVSVFFSGDTVVDEQDSRWMRAWLRHVLSVAESRPELPHYWLLLTATHRSYRFLPGFFRQFAPRRDGDTPPWLARVIDVLVREAIDENYDPQRGVVQLRRATPVRAEQVPTASRPRDDADVAFFRQRNPGYLNGDYLACLAEISRANLTPAGLRLLG